MIKNMNDHWHQRCLSTNTSTPKPTIYFCVAKSGISCTFGIHCEVSISENTDTIENVSFFFCRYQHALKLLQSLVQGWKQVHSTHLRSGWNEYVTRRKQLKQEFETIVEEYVSSKATLTAWAEKQNQRWLTMYVRLNVISFPKEMIQKISFLLVNVISIYFMNGLSNILQDCTLLLCFFFLSGTNRFSGTCSNGATICLYSKMLSFICWNLIRPRLLLLVQPIRINCPTMQVVSSWSNNFVPSM